MTKVTTDSQSSQLEKARSELAEATSVPVPEDDLADTKPEASASSSGSGLIQPKVELEPPFPFTYTSPLEVKEGSDCSVDFDGSP